jgi:hypothetical protein
VDSYVVRIYRRGGKKSRILVGTVEEAGADKKMAFSNIEELWEILRRRKGRDLCARPSPRRRLQEEVMSVAAASDSEESAKGVRPTNPPWDIERGRIR